MSKDAIIRLDISGTIKHYLTPGRKVPQSFGIDKYDGSSQSGDFAIFSNEGGVKDGVPVKTDHFALILCIRGSCLKTVGQFTFEVVPQSIHIISPGELNSFKDGSDDLLLYMLLFRKEFIANTFIKEGILETLLDLNPEHPPIYLLNNNEYAVTRRLFEKIEREYRQENSFYLQMVRLMIVELLYEINRSVEKSQKDPVKQVGRQFSLVRAFRRLVADNFLHMRTVQQYAEKLHVSARHLSEQVKHETGENALTIIHKRIYLEAQYLLSTSLYSIKEVADKLNFDTSSHFSRFFKHFAGINPSQFKAVP